MSEQQPLSSQECAGSSKACTDSKEYQEKTAEVENLLAEGKRLGMAHIFDESADKYELAANIATDYFGQFAVECFMPALNLGKMLVEVARMDALPVNTPMDAIDEDDEDEEEEDQEETEMQENKSKTDTDGKEQRMVENYAMKVGETIDENMTEETTEEKQEAAISEEKQQQETQQKGEKLVENGATEMEDGENEKTSTADETLVKENGEVNIDGEDAEEEGEPGDIQVAWEWLEIARKICDKQEVSDYWLQAKSDVHVALGECMTVADNFEQAIGEFTAALEIRQKIFPSTDRRIAEVLFFLGLTHGNLDDFGKSAEYFEKAAEVLRGAIQDKQKQLEAEKVDQEKVGILAEEVVELKKVVESVEESIRDSRESMEARARQKEAEKEMLPQTKTLPNVTTTSVAGADSEISDLSTMIKRKTVKRPLEMEGEQHTAEATDMKTNGNDENGTLANGTVSSNGGAKTIANGTPQKQHEPEQKRVKFASVEEVEKNA